MLITFDDTMTMQEASAKYNSLINEYMNLKDEYTDELDTIAELESEAELDRNGKKDLRASKSKAKKLYRECVNFLEDKLKPAKQDLEEVLKKLANEANRKHKNKEKDYRKEYDKQLDRDEAKQIADKEIRKRKSELDELTKEHEENTKFDKAEARQEKLLNIKSQVSSLYKKIKQDRQDLNKLDTSSSEYKELKQEYKELYDKLSNIESKYPELANEIQKEKDAIDLKFTKDKEEFKDDNDNPYATQLKLELDDLYTEYESISKQLASAEENNDEAKIARITKDKRSLIREITTKLAKLSSLSKDFYDDANETWNETKSKDYKSLVSKSMSNKEAEEALNRVNELLVDYESTIMKVLEADNDLTKSSQSVKLDTIRQRIYSLITKVNNASAYLNRPLQSRVKDLKEEIIRLDRTYTSKLDLDKKLNPSKTDRRSDAVNNGIYVIRCNGNYCVGYDKDDKNKGYVKPEFGSLKDAVWSFDKSDVEDYARSLNIDTNCVELVKGTSGPKLREIIKIIEADPSNEITDTLGKLKVKSKYGKSSSTYNDDDDYAYNEDDNYTYNDEDTDQSIAITDRLLDAANSFED